MTTPEDRLRDAMDAYASQVPVDPHAWARLNARLHHDVPDARRRWWASGTVRGVAAGIALVAFSLVLLVLRTGDDARRVGTGPAATVGPDQSLLPRDPTPVMPPLPAGAPRSFVAVRAESTQLALVASATGRVIRTLVDLGPRQRADGDDLGSPYIDAVSLTPNGESVYYSVGPEADGPIYRVATVGGDPEEITTGRSPVVSPDGARLAFMRRVADGGRYGVVVRDLATGDERVLEERDEGVGDIVGTTGWTTDGRYVLAEEFCQEACVSAVLVDTASSGEAALEDPHLHRDPNDAVEGQGPSSWRADARAVDGLVGFIEVCCPGIEGTGPRPGGDSFAVIDPVTGLLKGRISLPFTATQAEYDVTGKHQLFVDTEGRVHRRSSGPDFVTYRLAGISLVDW
jgi:hypothetical protein